MVCSSAQRRSGSIAHEVIRVFRVLVPASILALFLLDVLLIFACYAAVSYNELDGDLYLFSLSGWQPIAVVEGLILLGMYFRHLYGDLRTPGWVTLLQQLSLIFGTTFIAAAIFMHCRLFWGKIYETTWILELCEILAVLVIVISLVTLIVRVGVYGIA